MNPSSSGWIHKFINEFEKETLVSGYSDVLQFYAALKQTGFIYGFSVKSLLSEPISTLQLTKEELTKINLFHTLFFVYCAQYPEATFEHAINDIVKFYKSIGKGKPGFFQKLSFTKSSSENLEQIIAARLNESNVLIKTETASLFTYALLFADVLAFQNYLLHPRGLKLYLEELEATLVGQSIRALQSKTRKNKYDLQVIEMVAESTLLEEATHVNNESSMSHALKNRTPLERRFILDICLLAIWNDQKIEPSEIQFLENIASQLEFSNAELTESVDALRDFSSKNVKKIKLFEYAHPVKQLYKQSSETVILLIMRNKNRLLRELNDSGELLKLLSHSTVRDLSPEEKHKVKVQLLDICKTVPSLTIFLLPGGSLLLPLLVKFIPKLLPSAFNENRVDD